jgi:hypothetical protein
LAGRSHQVQAGIQRHQNRYLNECGKLNTSNARNWLMPSSPEPLLCLAFTN